MTSLTSVIYQFKTSFVLTEWYVIIWERSSYQLCFYQFIVFTILSIVLRKLYWKTVFFFKTIISIGHFQDFYFIFLGHCLLFIRYFVRFEINSELTIAIHLRLLFITYQGLSIGRRLCLFHVLFLEKYS